MLLIASSCLALVLKLHRLSSLLLNIQLLETCSGIRQALKSHLVVTCWALVFVFWTIKFPLLSLLVLLIASSCVALTLELHRLASLLLNLAAFLLRRAFGSQVAPLLLVIAAYCILP
ncbi:hypothetical protein M0R45_005364 [Rubus argutus]|uniref:Uncharacterized protein n=1 Tax=Rubus argutus TaxID=59490 RepID=A0AAW1YMI7_RUBAR